MALGEFLDVVEALPVAVAAVLVVQMEQLLQQVFTQGPMAEPMAVVGHTHKPHHPAVKVAAAQSA